MHNQLEALRLLTITQLEQPKKLMSRPYIWMKRRIIGAPSEGEDRHRPICHLTARLLARKIHGRHKMRDDLTAELADCQLSQVKQDVARREGEKRWKGHHDAY